MNVSELSMTHGLQTDKFSYHNYRHFYDAEFATRQESAKRILEIGVFQGASVRLWHEFFPNAVIDGLDNGAHWDGPPIRNYPRLRLWYGDAYVLTTYTDLVMAENKTPFDLIIDDGSHNPFHQWWVYESLPQFLAPGGMLVIEDIGIEGMFMFQENLGNAMEMLDWTHMPGAPDDDRMLILRKNNSKN